MDLPASSMFNAEPRMIAPGDKQRIDLRQSSVCTHGRSLRVIMLRCLPGESMKFEISPRSTIQLGLVGHGEIVSL